MKRSIDTIDKTLTVITWIGYMMILAASFRLSWELFFAGVFVALISTGLYEVRG